MVSAFAVLAALAIAMTVIFAIGILALIRVSRGRDIRAPDSPLERLFLDLVQEAVPYTRLQAKVEQVYSFGKADPMRDGRALVFRATIGWRLGYLAGLVFVIFFCSRIEADPATAGQTPAFIHGMGAMALVSCGVYLWWFRLRIDGNDLTCTTGTLRTRRFDLALLDEVRKTKDGYRMRFSDGAMVTLPQFLEGRDVLLGVLIRTLERNGR